MISGNKNIALISAINNNYGTMLQAYAMQTVLQNQGLDVDVFNYVSNPVKQFYRVLNFTFLITKLKAIFIKIVAKIFYPQIYSKIKIREKAFVKFKNECLHLTERINSRSELTKKILQYDAAILGSDQVWNPQNLEMDYYTLNFVPDNIPKITFAPSFGVNDIPKYQIEKTIKYLSRIEHISVRELNGARIIKELINRDVEPVCDPTALLTSSDWDKLNTDKKYIDGDYIFCYFLGDNIIHRDFANKVAQKLNCKIISIQHMDEFVKSDLKFSDLAVYDVGPGDFINLIANSKLVITDSFHGTMFSIYYRKPFYVLNYSKKENSKSVNSRIESIVKTLEISSRRIKGNENLENLNFEDIDWNNIYYNLDKLRSNSFKYLLGALRDENLVC